LLIRHAARAVLWDEAGARHVHGRDLDVLLRDGRVRSAPACAVDIAHLAQEGPPH
jgi:hypothetical protein